MTEPWTYGRLNNVVIRLAENVTFHWCDGTTLTGPGEWQFAWPDEWLDSKGDSK